MEILGSTTSILSWQIIQSAISSLKNSKPKIEIIDISLEAIPCIILSCVAVEAFSNEISSLTYSFTTNLDNSKKNKLSESEIKRYENIANIKNTRAESYYERYKLLLKRLEIEQPNFLEDLNHLQELRNSLVHFRLSDVSVVIDNDGVIKHYQEPPEVFKHLKSKKVKNWHILAADVENNSAWNLRISTNAMCIWAIKINIEAITYVLYNLKEGEHKNFILKYYKDKDNLGNNVFEKGKTCIQEIEGEVFK